MGMNDMQMLANIAGMTAELIESGKLVRVVRCKDCRHWDYRTEGCMHPTGRIAPIVKTGADWYCCDGERKDT